MKANFGVLACLLAAFLGSAAVAQDEPAEDPIDQLLSQYEVEDLRQMLFEAELALSYNGQVKLEKKARLTHIMLQVKPIVDKYNDDDSYKRSVDSVQTALQANRQKLLDMVELDDQEELDRQFIEFLENASLRDEDLKAFVQWRDADSAYTSAEAGIAKIDKLLSKKAPAVRNDEALSFTGYAARARAVVETIADESIQETESADKGEMGNSKERLKQLLGI